MVPSDVCLSDDPSLDAVPVPDPQGQVPNALSFAMSTMNATRTRGGTIKIVDSTIFPIAKTLAVADVTVEPGAMRELHVSSIGCIKASLIDAVDISGIPLKTNGLTSCEPSLLISLFMF